MYLKSLIEVEKMKIFDIIKFEGNNDVFVWKFPGEDFNTLSQLIVSESQEAVFYKDGKALDLFGPGRYTLHTQNIPLVRKLVNLPFNGESPFHCQVYFINKVVSMDVMWETHNKIPIQDALYKIIVPVGANGQFAVRVTDSKKSLINLVGNIDCFDQATLKKYFKGILLTNIKDYISKEFVQHQVSFLEITAHLKEISDGIRNSLSAEFSKYGIELINFNVNEISPSEDDPSYIQLRKALAKKAEMSVIGYNYQQERAFNVLDSAAQNNGSSANIMGAVMGLGMGMNIGSVLENTMGNTMSIVKPDMKSQNMNSQNDDMITCENCGKLTPKDSKFCLECGAKVKAVVNKSQKKCPNCGALVPIGKFCLECGARLDAVCPNCGESIVPGANFCLNCGKKLN